MFGQIWQPVVMRNKPGADFIHQPVERFRQLVPLVPQLVEQITQAARKVGLHREHMTESPITGDTGNREFFLHLRQAVADLERSE